MNLPARCRCLALARLDDATDFWYWCRRYGNSGLGSLALDYPESGNKAPSEEALIFLHYIAIESFVESRGFDH
jgi:hypothetical protein